MIFDCFQGDDENLYASIHELRDKIEEISTQIQEEAAEITRASGAGLGLPVADRINNMQKLDAQFREKQEELQLLIQERGARWVRPRKRELGVYSYVICEERARGRRCNLKKNKITVFPLLSSPSQISATL